MFVSVEMVLFSALAIDIAATLSLWHCSNLFAIGKDGIAPSTGMDSTSRSGPMESFTPLIAKRNTSCQSTDGCAIRKTC